MLLFVLCLLTYFLFLIYIFVLFFYICLFCYFIYLYSYYYCYYLGKMIFYKTTLISIHLIKGIVLGRALWGANTFPIRNRLPNLWIWFVDIFKFGFSMVFHNKLWWRPKSLFNIFKKLFFDRPVVIPVATDTIQLIQQFIHNGYREAVFDSNCIQIAIIHTEAPCSIFLLN